MIDSIEDSFFKTNIQKSPVLRQGVSVLIGGNADEILGFSQRTGTVNSILKSYNVGSGADYFGDSFMGYDTNHATV